MQPRESGQPTQGNNHQRHHPRTDDDDLLAEPHRLYTIKTSDTGMTWVHIYKWVDMRAATDPTDAMNVIRNNEQQEQA